MKLFSSRIAGIIRINRSSTNRAPLQAHTPNRIWMKEAIYVNASMNILNDTHEAFFFRCNFASFVHYNLHTVFLVPHINVNPRAGAF